MSYFNHGEWQSIKADLQLQPLPANAGDVISRLLGGEVMDYPSKFDQAVLGRLLDLDLIEFVDDGSWQWSEIDKDEGEVIASDMLAAIQSRGLLAELFA